MYIDLIKKTLFLQIFGLVAFIKQKENNYSYILIYSVYS